MTIGVWVAVLGVCAVAFGLEMLAIVKRTTNDIDLKNRLGNDQKTETGIARKIGPENIEKKLRMNAKIGLSAVTSPGGEGFVEVVEGEEMQDDGEF